MSESAWYDCSVSQTTERRPSFRNVTAKGHGVRSLLGLASKIFKALPNTAFPAPMMPLLLSDVSQPTTAANQWGIFRP